MRILPLFAPATLALTLALGCHAQPPAGTLPASRLAPAELARRVEILIRTRTKLPPNYSVLIGPRTKSEIPGFDTIDVVFSDDGSPSRPIPFLLSTDGKTVAQFNKYDIAADPKALVSSAGRPARGGPESAPVEIVGFDDLECPFCTRMHASLFPALTERYGTQIHFVYRAFPLTNIHPWAMRAAIDTDCLAAQSSPAYWSAVDYIHAHASDLAGPEHSITKANEALDAVALSEATRAHLNSETLQACIKKQDDSAVKASMKVGEALGIEATPILFINGEKFEGAYPLVDVFRMVDGALIAAGKTPPPAYVPLPPSPQPTPPKSTK